MDPIPLRRRRCGGGRGAGGGAPCGAVRAGGARARTGARAGAGAGGGTGVARRAARATGRQRAAGRTEVGLGCCPRVFIHIYSVLYPRSVSSPRRLQAARVSRPFDGPSDLDGLLGLLRALLWPPQAAGRQEVGLMKREAASSGSDGGGAHGQNMSLVIPYIWYTKGYMVDRAHKQNMFCLHSDISSSLLEASWLDWLRLCPSARTHTCAPII